jgi:TetR/AcrR family tetracycline transcriptional repressor
MFSIVTGTPYRRRLTTADRDEPMPFRRDWPSPGVTFPTVTLDRGQVVAAAIELLDAVGLEQLTLRRLGAELDVQAPALYWHFKNKQDLLDQMFVTIMEVEAPFHAPEPTQMWETWLRQRAREIRSAINKHRDGAMLAASTRPQPSQWRDLENHLSVLANAGMTAAEALGALRTVRNYVSGFTLEEQGEGRSPIPADADPDEFEGALAEFADYPLLVEALREVGGPHSDQAFDNGLRLIIDGVRRQMRQRRAASASAT